MLNISRSSLCHLSGPLTILYINLNGVKTYTILKANSEISQTFMGGANEVMLHHAALRSWCGELGYMT